MSLIIALIGLNPGSVWISVLSSSCTTHIRISIGGFKKESRTEDSLRRISKECWIDLWVCHHFRVLPTSVDFKNLTELQKYLLFLSWLELPTSDDIRHRDLLKRGKIGETLEIPDEIKEELNKMGWTEEQIEKAKEEVHELNLEKLSEG